MAPNPGFAPSSVMNSIISVEKAVKDHYAFHQSEMEVQRVILDRMWVIAQRYTILTKAGPSRFIEPTLTSHRVEDDVKVDFLTKLISISDSNFKLNSSLTNVKEKFRQLIEAITERNINCPDIEDEDDLIRPPISYNIELFGDILKHFDHTQCTLNAYGHLLAPDDVSSTERYKKLLEPNKDFNDYFLKSMAYYGYSTLSKQRRGK